MAPFRRSRGTSNNQTILDVSFLINNDPLLLLRLCFQAFVAAIQGLVRFTTQTGSILFSWRKPSFSSEVHDGDDDAGYPYVFSSGKSDLKNTNRLIEIGDRGFGFESESVKTVHNTAPTPPLKNDPFDLKDTSLGIQDIVSQTAQFGGKNVNIAVALSRKDISLFQRYGRCTVLHCN